MADSALVGPFREAHLADQFGLAEMGRARQGRFIGFGAAKWRLLPAALAHQLMDVLELGVIEAGADLFGETQAPVALVLPEQQRTEEAAASGGIGIAADHEAGASAGI